MAGFEGGILPVAFKQRLQPFPCRAYTPADALKHVDERIVCIYIFPRASVHCRAQRHGVKAEFGKDRSASVKPERMGKTLSESAAIVQRPTEEHDLSFYAASLYQSGDGLVHHGLENACRYVRFCRALIEKGLDIGLGKHSAARGDGIYFIMLQTDPVHFLNGHVEQYGHLIDKRARASRTASVHALVEPAAEKNDFGVLAPELYHGSGIRLEVPDRLASGVNLLHKRQ